MTRTFGYKRPWRPHLGLRMSFAPEQLDGLPDAVDLRPKMPEVYDQGQLGSCTAHALAGAIHHALLRDERDGLLAAGVMPFVPSRLAIYYAERAIEGSESDDAGALLGDGIRALMTFGFADEALWPYDPDRFAEAPPEAYERAAAHARLVNAEALDHDRQTLLWTLACGFPFVFGITVHRSFETAPGGVVELPGPEDPELGGHALLCVGYDRGTERFLVRNSWGPGWGDGGYCTIPFAYLLDPLLCGELFAVRGVRVRP